LYFILVLLQGSIGKCEEALEKNSIADCESGIAYASEAIERFKDDAKLYLLRAKLLFKLVSRIYHTVAFVNDIFTVNYFKTSWQS